MIKKIALAISTGLGAGYFPKLPGTIGSLWGMLIFALFPHHPLWHLTAIPVLLLAGIWAATTTEEIFGKKDASQIVIDEVVGQLIAYAFIPFSFFNLILGFLLFRLFDVIKPFPARWAQDNFPKGYGVMLDDVVAGLQAGILALLFNHFF